MSFLVIWLLSCLLVAWTKERKDEMEIHTIKVIATGTVLAIGIGILYWCYLLSQVFGIGVWIILIASVVAISTRVLKTAVGLKVAKIILDHEEAPKVRRRKTQRRRKRNKE